MQKYDLKREKEIEEKQVISSKLFQPHNLERPKNTLMVTLDLV